MSVKISLEKLVQLVDGDQELIAVLFEQGVLVRDSQGFGVEEVDCVLTSRTLVRQLEVNWPGVDIILRLRRQLAIARSRIAELESQQVTEGSTEE